MGVALIAWGRFFGPNGDALRSRTRGRQTTEVAIAVASLNRMLVLGRPEWCTRQAARRSSIRRWRYFDC